MCDICHLSSMTCFIRFWDGVFEYTLYVMFSDLHIYKFERNGYCLAAFILFLLMEWEYCVVNVVLSVTEFLNFCVAMLELVLNPVLNEASMLRRTLKFLSLVQYYKVLSDHSVWDFMWSTTLKLASSTLKVLVWVYHTDCALCKMLVLFEHSIEPSVLGCYVEPHVKINC